MMRAVAAYARDERNPLPPELARAMRCREWRCLPRAGGEMDQPAGLLEKMTAAWNVYTAVQEYERNGRKPGEMVKWRNEHPETAKMMDYLKKAKWYE